MNKKVSPIHLEVDLERYQQMVNHELERTARGTIDNRLKLLFANPSIQPDYDNLRSRNNNDPDLSAAYTFIKEIIDRKLLDDKFQKYIEDYADKHFGRLLEEALERALEHKANSMARRMTKGKLTIDGMKKNG